MEKQGIEINETLTWGAAPWWQRCYILVTGHKKEENKKNRGRRNSINGRKSILSIEDAKNMLFIVCPNAVDGAADVDYQTLAEMCL